MAATSGVTKVTEVLEQLRKQILYGKLMPGEKLRLEHLAPRFKVGRTPLREACSRLVSEGLVTSEDQRGFRVSATSRPDHAALPLALLSACGSPTLLRFHAALFEQSERYRRLAVAYGQPARDIHREHEALARVALARDAERACALLVEHIAATTDRVLAAHPQLQS